MSRSKNRLRAALHERAGEVDVHPRRPGGRVRARSRASGAARAWREPRSQPSPSRWSGSASRPELEHERVDRPRRLACGRTARKPAMITLDAPGWTVDFVAVVNPDYTEYQFSDGTQSLQVAFYPLGSRTGNSTNPRRCPFAARTASPPTNAPSLPRRLGRAGSDVGSRWRAVRRRARVPRRARPRADPRTVHRGKRRCPRAVCCADPGQRRQGRHVVPGQRCRLLRPAELGAV